MSSASRPTSPMSKRDFEELARFRFTIQGYLRRSELLVRRHGIPPQQYAVLLAIKGHPDRDWASVQEIADMMHLKHHSTVELIDRAQARELVERSTDPVDGRVVRVQLTPAGEAILNLLGPQHVEILQELQPVIDSVQLPAARG